MADYSLPSIPNFPLESRSHLAQCLDLRWWMKWDDRMPKFGTRGDWLSVWDYISSWKTSMPWPSVSDWDKNVTACLLNDLIMYLTAVLPLHCGSDGNEATLPKDTHSVSRLQTTVMSTHFKYLCWAWLSLAGTMEPIEESQKLLSLPICKSIWKIPK